MNKANIIKWLSLAGKGIGLFIGLASYFTALPFVSPELGTIIFAVASLLKDVVNRVGDLADDGKANDSFRVS